MEGLRGQGSKEMEIMSTTTTTTLGYNLLPNRNSSSSSSKFSSPIAGHRTSSDHQHQHQPPPPPVAHTNNTLIFNDSPQTSNHHHQNHHHQFQRTTTTTTTTDPDLTPSSSPLATTTTTTTPRTAPPPPPPPPTPLVRYRECLKNHAASMGSHVVDGCGEFMPSGEENTPESLKCAACDCHRNFHRKEVEGEPQQLPNYHHTYYKHSNGHLPLPAPPPPPPPQPQQPPSSLHHRFSHAAAGPVPVPPLMMAFGGGAAAESSSEDLNMLQCNAGGQLSAPELSRKRHRTKFSKQQKDEMMEFAEKIGWRIQKHDEQEVQQFCSQLGVKRQVFKVWMHNNKQAMKKLQQM